MSDIETEVIPPDTDEDGDGGSDSTRLTASVIVPDGRMFDASVQVFDEEADSPESFADNLLNVALALASMRGADYSWAVMQRFAAYDGMSR